MREMAVGEEPVNVIEQPSGRYVAEIKSWGVERARPRYFYARRNRTTLRVTRSSVRAFLRW